MPSMLKVKQFNFIRLYFKVDRSNLYETTERCRFIIRGPVFAILSNVANRNIQSCEKRGVTRTQSEENLMAEIFLMEFSVEPNQQIYSLYATCYIYIHTYIDSYIVCVHMCIYIHMYAVRKGQQCCDGETCYFYRDTWRDKRV